MCAGLRSPSSPASDRAGTQGARRALVRAPPRIVPRGLACTVPSRRRSWSMSAGPTTPRRTCTGPKATSSRTSSTRPRRPFSRRRSAQARTTRRSSLATNHGCLEFQHAFADELAAFAARMRSRGKHGAFHAEFVAARRVGGRPLHRCARSPGPPLPRRAAVGPHELAPRTRCCCVVRKTGGLCPQRHHAPRGAPYASQRPTPRRNATPSTGASSAGPQRTDGQTKAVERRGRGDWPGRRAATEIWRTRSQVLRVGFGIGHARPSRNRSIRTVPLLNGVAGSARPARG